MRERARTAVRGLARLAARGALVVQDDGTHAYLPVDEIQPGMHILLAAGERVPVDARVDNRTVRARLLAGVRREPAAAGRPGRGAVRRVR